MEAEHLLDLCPRGRELLPRSFAEVEIDDCSEHYDMVVAVLVAESSGVRHGLRSSHLDEMAGHLVEPGCRYKLELTVIVEGVLAAQQGAPGLGLVEK